MAKTGGFLGAAVAAALAFATPASANWPHTVAAQPLWEMRKACAPNIVPINRRCRVIDFAPLGVIDGRTWFYAFYATHWADRHGRMDRGFPVFLYRQGPASVRLGLWVNDAPGLAGRWAWTPPERPVLIPRPDGIYMGLTLKNVGDAPDQRLFRQHGERWTQIRILERSDRDQATLDAATPRGCSVAGDGIFDWRAFTLTLPLRTDLAGRACGSLVAGLGVEGERASLVSVRLVP